MQVKLQISHQVLAHKHVRDARTGHSVAEALGPNLGCLEAHGQVFCALCSGLSQVPGHLVAGGSWALGGLPSAAFRGSRTSKGSLRPLPPLEHLAAGSHPAGGYPHCPCVGLVSLTSPGAPQQPGGCAFGELHGKQPSKSCFHRSFYSA